jgi:large subunit ribosomal protein L24
MARHIKRGDTVIVIAGSDKGRTGKVLRVLLDKDRVVVEGVNRVWKHVRPSQRTPQGGRIQKDAPIHISNVQPVDPATGKATRVKFEDRNGEKHRVAIAGGTDLGRLGKSSGK